MAAAGTGAVVDATADKLWEDDNFDYEEYDDDEAGSDEDIQGLTDEELDAELDRIDAEEEALSNSDNTKTEAATEEKKKDES